MNDLSSSEAAEVVLRERERQRQADDRKKKASSDQLDEEKKPSLETVSTPKWDGAEAGEVDESELDRRQRALAEQLERRQREVIRQSKQLARVRDDLKALELPIKAEIMQLRERLEDANRREVVLVDTVNSLRKDLFEKEKGLKNVREEKQTLADDLIKVMADYERRKTERLNEIAELVGDKPVEQPKASNFAGF